MNILKNKDDNMFEFKDFSDAILANLENFEEDYPVFINCGPNLFDLLCNILDQEVIDKESRLEVSAAISYYVVPNDVIPEEIYGPYGYVDDIFISVYVLRKIADKFGYGFLQDIWGHNTDVKEVMDMCYAQSLEILDDKLYEILKYVGLVD